MQRIAIAAFALFALTAAVRADDDTVKTIIDLVSDKDKDVRAIGLEQVRDEAKGAATTRRFAALLPKLAPERKAAWSARWPVAVTRPPSRRSSICSRLPKARSIPPQSARSGRWVIRATCRNWLACWPTKRTKRMSFLH